MTPFIIVSIGRTGSTLLKTTVKQHPAIKAYGEIFNPDGVIRTSSLGITQGGRRFFYDPEQHDPIDFLKQYIWNAENQKYSAVGFKLLGGQLRGDLFLRLKNEFSGLRIVHIVRPNYLEAFVSQQIAVTTGRWAQRKKEKRGWRQLKNIVKNMGRSRAPGEDVVFKVEPQEVKAHFDWRRATESFFRSSCTDLPYLEVSYDELVARYRETSASVFRFLGVPTVDVTPKLEKQGKRSPDQVLTNFDQLAAYFARTEYAALFQSCRSSQICRTHKPLLRSWLRPLLPRGIVSSTAPQSDDSSKPHIGV
jgi:hypothetical protein